MSQVSAYQDFAHALDTLKAKDNHRQLVTLPQHDGFATIGGQKRLNLSSNDYLGLAADTALKAEFEAANAKAERAFSSSSSRLLTGTFPEHAALEKSLSDAYGRASLVFNSGYHMNIGILPAISQPSSLILSDELIHASMIDGIRLTRAKRERFPHCDLNALESKLKQAQADPEIDRIIVVTESLFSMDGDRTDLKQLVALKKRYPKTLLYLDEAHAVGVYGKRGLGLAEAGNCMADIDFLVGTFGKALASVGGFVICHSILRDYLLNKARSFIFSTALPPINLAWTRWVFNAMQQMQDRRQQLHTLSVELRTKLTQKGLACPGDSHIVPVVYGDNALTITKAKQCQEAGFHVMPIRPPTVAKGRARVRLCLHAGLTSEQLKPLEAVL